MHVPLPVIQVDLGRGVRAGFTTRAGGVSSGVYASLNLGALVGDRPGHVRANRVLVSQWAGGPVVFGTQVHGADIAHVSAGPAGVPLSVDGLVSGDGTGVGVLVADCVPVLLADPVAQVVAAVHAGRAGLAAGVVQAAVAALVARGAAADRIRAVVGPAICGDCYEVPATLRAEVSDVVAAAWATTSWGTPALDLPRAVGAVLAMAGIRAVARVDACTRTDARFFSHRRAQVDGATTGRFAAIVRATGPIPGVSGEVSAEALASVNSQDMGVREENGDGRSATQDNAVPRSR